MKPETIEEKIAKYRTVDVHILKKEFPKLFKKAHERFVDHLSDDPWHYQDMVEGCKDSVEGSYREFGMQINEIDWHINYDSVSLQLTADIDVTQFLSGQWDDSVNDAQEMMTIADKAGMLEPSVNVECGYNYGCRTPFTILYEETFDDDEQLKAESLFDGMNLNDFVAVIREHVENVEEAMQEATDAMHTDLESDINAEIENMHSEAYFIDICDDYAGFFLIDVENNRLVEQVPYG